MHARPVEAARAVLALLRNPDDTAQVFRLVGATGGTPAGLVRAFERSAGGQALLAERPDVRPLLEDRAALARLPEGSLGRAYLAFMESDRLDAGFLVEADRKENPRRAGETDAERWIGERLRDTHDLWHALTGYGGDVLGEAALLAFSFAQTRGPAIGILSSVAFLHADDEDARRLILDGFARGLSAAWLPGVRWEGLLAEPVVELRERLRVGAPRAYAPVRAAELGPGGLLGARRAARSA